MARTIRFMFEYGQQWPLWENGAEGGPTMEPADYGLSAELTERLRLLTECWQQHFHYETGWDSPEHLTTWKAQTDQALAVLRREVAAIADVVDERGL